MNQINIGIVGFGHAARKYALPGLAAHPRARVVVTTAKDVPHPAVLERPDLDAVIITTPPACHYQEAKMALEAGKHVMLEKPATMDPGQAEELVRLAQVKGLQVMVHQNVRFSPGVVYMQNLIYQGILGKIQAINGDFKHAGPKSAWHFDPLLSGPGGSFFDLGIHLVDAVRFITGKELSPPGKKQLMFEGKVDREAKVSYTIPEGIPVNLHTSWRFPGTIGRLDLYCEAGFISAVFRPFGKEEVLIRSELGIQQITTFAAVAGLNPFYYFIEAISGNITGDPMGISLANNLPGLAATLSVYAG